MLCVCGYGIITKDRNASADIVTKVTSDGDKFLYTSADDGRFLFVRREQISGVIETLGSLSGKIVCTECIQTDNIEEEVSEMIKQFYDNHVNLKTIFKPSDQSAALADILGNRLRLPVLLLVLSLLVVNFIIVLDIRKEYGQSHARLVALEQNINKTGGEDQQRKQILSDYENTLDERFALLLDRVGALTPAKITLTKLSVQPLLKPIEHNKKPIIAPRNVVICGEALSSEDISLYTTALQREKFVKDLRLSSVQKQADSGLFIFQIDISL